MNHRPEKDHPSCRNRQCSTKLDDSNEPDLYGGLCFDCHMEERLEFYEFAGWNQDPPTP